MTDSRVAKLTRGPSTVSSRVARSSGQIASQGPRRSLVGAYVRYSPDVEVQQPDEAEHTEAVRAAFGRMRAFTFEKHRLPD